MCRLIKLGFKTATWPYWAWRWLEEPFDEGPGVPGVLP